MLLFGVIAPAIVGTPAIANACLQAGQAKLRPPDDPNLELLPVDLFYDRLRLNSDLPILHSETGQIFLPLRQFCIALGFRVHVNPELRTAKGFLADPTDRIFLDASLGQFMRKGHPTTFAPALCFPRDKDLYVDSELLMRWTGLHLKLLLNDLELDVVSDTPLRVRQISMMEGVIDAEGAQLLPGHMAYVQMPYSLWSIPSVDINWYSNTGLGDKASIPLASRLLVQGSGDLLFLSAHYLYISANANTPAAALLNLGREDAHARLLGPLKATQFTFGDLNLPQQSLFATSRNGLGFTASNFPLPNSFFGIGNSIEGQGPAHSSVELYRGTELVSIVRTDANGHYAFNSLPLESGPNDLRIVLLTPDGDVREERRTVYGETPGPSMGQGRYRLTVDHVGESLMPHALDNLSFAKRRTEYIGEYQWGLSASTWLAGTLAEAGGQLYAGVGVHTWLGGSLWNIDSMASGNGGTAFSAGVSRRYGRATVSLEHILTSRDFGSSLAPEIPGDTTSLTKLRVDGSFGSRSQPIGYGLSVDRATGANPVTFVRALVGVRQGNTFYSNTFATRLGGDAPDMTGVLQINRSFGATSGHFDIAYGLGKERLLQGIQTSYDLGVSSGYRMRFGLGYDPSLRGGIESTVAVYRMIGPVELGLNLTADVRGALKLSLLLSTGFAGQESMRGIAFVRPGATTAGNVSVRVFLDHNMDGKFDEGDTWLANVGLRVEGRASNIRTGPDGSCLLINLPSSEEISVALNEDSFENPAWLAETAGALVTTRTGRVAHVEFGVIETAELEGTVSGPGSLQAELTAQLVDKDGKPAYISVVDGDGLYVFSQIRPGPYTLRLVNPAGVGCGEKALVITPGGILKKCDLAYVAPAVLPVHT